MVVVGYGISFYALSVSLRSDPARASSTPCGRASGTAVIVLIGWVLFREMLDAVKLAGIGLIIIGVVMLNGTGSEQPSPPASPA